jgi:hypothetical protein
MSASNSTHEKPSLTTWLSQFGPVAKHDLPMLAIVSELSDNQCHAQYAQVACAVFMTVVLS